MKRAQRGAPFKQLTSPRGGRSFNKQDDLELDYLDDEDLDAEYLDKIIAIEEDFEQDDSLAEADLRNELGIKIDRQEDD
jgi:hypothetical protein